MGKKTSRYLMNGESYSAIARRPAGEIISLALNTREEDAGREASKSLKSAFSREGRSCAIRSGSVRQAFPGRRPPAGEHTTHLWVEILPARGQRAT